jgi:CRISPR associated protein Cas2
MALYFISYDLRKNRDYQKLYDALKAFKAVRILESQWCFNRINTSAAGLRDHFKQFIDSDDGLSVAEVTDWATWNTLGTPDDLK